MFEQIVAPTVKELFIERIESSILSGELAVGDKLPSERELAEQMNISKTAVHSGIADLQRKGFLKVIPRVGIFVDDYAANGNMEVLESIMKNGNLTVKNIQSMLEVRSAIECIAIKNIIEENNPETLERLNEIYEDILKISEEHPGDYKKIAEAHYFFHHEICVLSGNIIIPLIMNGFKDTAIRMWTNSIRVLGVGESNSRILTLLKYLKENNLEKAQNHIRWICESSNEIVND